MTSDTIPDPRPESSQALELELPAAIAYILRFERTGRPLAAALGLVVLRERFDELSPQDRGAEDWPAFVRLHFSDLGPARVADLVGMMVHRGGPLRCSKCGIEVRCACSCGVPYLVSHRWAPTSANQRATDALAADPSRSNRAIATEIGVSEMTVRRARRQIEEGADP